MNWPRRMGMLTAGTALTVMAAMSAGGAALAAPSGHPVRTVNPPFRVKVIGRLPNGKPRLTSTSPTGLSPGAIHSVYSLSGLSPSSGAGAGQIIAIVDAYHDPHALSDLNAFNARYGYAQLSACTSLSQSGPCFRQADPQGTPKTNSGWVLEESLDIEWAHAEAPAAKIVLVEAASNSDTNLFNAVSYANSIGATEVSMSWGGGEFSGETAFDADMTQAGTFYTASSGDSGHGAEYPAASPNVIAVGGTTLNGCSGTSCSGFTSEGAPDWAGILAAGAAAGKTALQGHSAIYSGGYATNLRDITSGTNGSCGTDCTAGKGYDLVTGLGSPINYP